MSPKCLICGNSSPVFLEQQGYIFNKCSICGFFFVNPMPNDSELLAVYSPKTGYQSHKINKDYKKETNLKYVKIFKKLKKYSIPNKKVLDVGASDGEFLYYAKREGFLPFGVEPNKTTADIANKNNLNVFCGFLNDSNFERNSFSLLRLGDVLEHSNDPHKLIDECREFLLSDGFLIVSIPNMDSTWAKSTYFLKKLFNLPWSVLTPPHHLLYFSKNNLDLFMEKKGFSLVNSWYNRPPTLKYELGSTHLFGKFKRQKNLKNLFVFLFGFASYSTLYLIDYLITLFKNKDFAMLCIYKKNA